MPQSVVAGATLACTFGAAPATLIVEPLDLAFAEGKPVATIMDFVPIKNIPTFGMCSAPTNPAVIAATAAKMGVFTPVPCLPATATPWVPGAPTAMIGNKPALDNASRCLCTWLGIITVANPGEATFQVP